MDINAFKEARDFIVSNTAIKDLSPHTAVVLGSGLSHFADNLKNSSYAKVIPFKNIPHFSSSTVEGHSGELIVGKLTNSHPIIAMSGRLHFYEGYNAKTITNPIRVLSLLGIKNLILTNAAGAIGDNYEPGQLMAIKDHINLSGINPLIGPNNPELGPRFVDMSHAYEPRFIEYALKAAEQEKITMHQGVYISVTGPSYETPAEIRMFKSMGADAVGMSTVLETIVARHMGIKVLGISCLTNKAAGLSTNTITHEEVMENNAKVAMRFSSVLEKIVAQIYAEK
ncbi:MAG: purine-nucleoside phosphorylase [Myxococcales bacterium]|nr:MAG: purine-nucleoside phosphorylase [Myxococcales bacterium]